MTTRQLTLACALLGAASAASATSVIPLALPELSREADAIVRVKVLDSGARWGEFHDAPAIVTDLELQVLEVLKGQAPRRLTVFGGTVGDQTLSLIGQPQLRAGDEAFVFLITREQVTCPFVGVWQGVYTVREGQVWREGAPLVDVIEGEPAFAEDHERGMSPRAFAAEIERALRVEGAGVRLDPIEAELPGRAEAPRASEAPQRVDAPPLPRLKLTPVHGHPHPAPARAAGGAQ